jgi:hypothetical protein
LAPPHGEDRARTNNSLDCLADANAALEAKGLFGPLSNHTDPPDKSKSPAGLPTREAQENDRLAGAIEELNTQPAENTQADDFGKIIPENNFGIIPENNPPPENTFGKLNCGNCGQAFEPRNRKRGSPQKFCSSECRVQAFRVGKDPNTQSVSSQTQSVSQSVSYDSPNVADAGELVTKFPHHFGTPTPPEDEFDWADDPDIVLRRQCATAVYFNKFDELVIRQQGFEGDSWGNTMDSCVYINQAFFKEFVNRLCAACGVNVTWGKPEH